MTRQTSKRLNNNITNNSGIYCIENVINGKKYIGRGKNLKKRMFDAHKSCKYIRSALRKYGDESFIRYVVEYCKLEDTTERERHYIREWKTKSPNGYNLTDGGEGSFGYSPGKETRKKMAKASRGRIVSDETKKKMKASALGRIVSADTREKLREKQLGKSLSEETKNKISNSKFGIKKDNASSKFFGVYRYAAYYKNNSYIYWKAGFRSSKGFKNIGTYKSEIEAVNAYDKYIFDNNLPNPLNFPNDIDFYSKIIKEESDIYGAKTCK